MTQLLVPLLSVLQPCKFVDVGGVGRAGGTALFAHCSRGVHDVDTCWYVCAPSSVTKLQGVVSKQALSQILYSYSYRKKRHFATIAGLFRRDTSSKPARHRQSHKLVTFSEFTSLKINTTP